MGDLEVDLDLLGETAGSLGMLMHEFDRAAVIVEDAESAIGRNAPLDEMREFVDEWKHNREKLLTSLRAVYEAYLYPFDEGAWVLSTSLPDPREADRWLPDLDELSAGLQLQATS
jgi:hypothetical protein